MALILFTNFLGRDSAITASEAVVPDYPLANLVDEARDTCAKGTVSNNQYIQFDIDLSTPPCDFFFLDRGHQSKTSLIPTPPKVQRPNPLWIRPLSIYGGEAGIRTLGRREPTPVFETGSFNHSDTSPHFLESFSRG